MELLTTIALDGAVWPRPRRRVTTVVPTPLHGRYCMDIVTWPGVDHNTNELMCIQQRRPLTTFAGR